MENSFEIPKVKNRIDASHYDIPEELGNARMSICLKCPFFDSNTEKCKACWCFLPFVTQLNDSVCPIGHW